MLDAVQRLAANWRSLAYSLHVRRDAIKVIQLNNPNDAGAALIDAIDEWMKKNYNLDKFGPPSWRMLASVVWKLDQDLAYHIASKHGGRSSVGR